MHKKQQSWNSSGLLRAAMRQTMWQTLIAWMLLFGAMMETTFGTTWQISSIVGVDPANRCFHLIQTFHVNISLTDLAVANYPAFFTCRCWSVHKRLKRDNVQNPSLQWDIASIFRGGILFCLQLHWCSTGSMLLYWRITHSDILDLFRS